MVEVECRGPARLAGHYNYYSLQGFTNFLNQFHMPERYRQSYIHTLKERGYLNVSWHFCTLEAKLS